MAKNEFNVFLPFKLLRKVEERVKRGEKEKEYIFQEYMKDILETEIPPASVIKETSEAKERQGPRQSPAYLHTVCWLQVHRIHIPGGGDLSAHLVKNSCLQVEKLTCNVSFTNSCIPAVLPLSHPAFMDN